MGGVGLLETPLGVLRSFCFTIAKLGFWLGDRMNEVLGKRRFAQKPRLELVQLWVKFWQQMF